MSETLLLSAFIAGIVTFFAPCTFPLLPAYLSLLGGSRSKRVWLGLWYVVGFSSIFIFFGASLGLFGAALVPWRPWLERAAGVFVILFGLILLSGKQGVFFRGIKLPFAGKTSSLPRPVAMWFLGASFGVGWTPCVGPILGAVLTLAAASATVGTGAILLGVYSLGLAVPFLLAAFAFDTFVRYNKKIIRFLPWLERVGGAVFIFLGILLLSGKSVYLAGWGYQFFEILNINWLGLYKFF